MMKQIVIKLPFLFTVWLCSLLCGKIEGQSNVDIYDSLNKLETVNLKKVADSLINLSEKNQDYVSAAKIANKYSRELFSERKYHESIEYFVKRREFRGLINKEDATYIKATYNLALVYRYNEEYDKSIEMMELLLKLKPDNLRLARAYRQIAICLSYKGDLRSSVMYFFKSIEILEKYDDNKNDLFRNYSNLFDVLIDIESESSQESLEILLNKMKTMKMKNDLTDAQLILLNNCQAKYFLKKGNKYILEIEKLYNLNLELAFKIKDSLIIGRSYINLSYLNNIQKNSQGLLNNKKALAFIKNSREDLIYAYENYSEYYELFKQPLKAIELIDRSIALNMSSTDSVELSLTRTDLYNVINKQQAIFALKKKTKLLIDAFLLFKDQRYLEYSINMTKVHDMLINMIANKINFSSKIDKRREASQAYLYGAYASHLLGDYDQVFEFMEKNKALLLSESVLKNTEFANLPKNISDEEIRRQKLIYKLEDELSQDSANLLIQDSLFVAKRSHEKYVDSLKTIFPKYYSRKIDLEQVSLKDVKDELNNNQVLISFIWNEFDRDNELVVGLVASNEFNRSFTINKTDNLKSLIKDYQKFISRPFETKDDEKEFQRIAFKLYQMLFPDQEIRNLIMKKELMIITDGLLQNIPFESLIRTADVNDYLVLNNNIHYLYSYSFLEQNKKVNRKSTNSFIGYSPNRFTDSLLINLSHTREEVTDINSEFGGVIKLNDSATKKDFLENSSSAKIIHLATHADGGENPWVAFADDKLQLHELYTFKNNADLVTLSACNTSLGDMAKGEGVISLARGFFHSGSKSVVSSLWKVNDKSTSRIMRSFYKGLKGGETKSEALNNAKRAYLNTNSLSAQSPYYWSSFVLLGDSSEVDVQSNNYLYYGLVLLFIPLGVLVRRKFRKAG